MEPKERLIKVGTALALGFTAFSSACATDAKFPSLENKPGISRTLTPDSPNAQWGNLPAIERLNKLLVKDYLAFADFDRQKEVTLATAQAYCNATKCHISAEELADSVHFVNNEEFIKKLSQEPALKSLTPEEIEKEERETLAITAHDDRHIYLNRDLLKTAVNTIISNQPDIVTRTGYNDFVTAYEISILIHEYTHKNQIKEKPRTFDGFSIGFHGKKDPINFDTLNGFKFEGRDSAGIPYFISGADEAIVDLAAYIITQKKLGIKYIVAFPNYQAGGKLVERVNSLANITDDEYLKYVRGDSPREDLLKKWGRFKTDKSMSDLKTGILVLATIGLAVQEFIDVQDAIIGIDKRLKVNGH